MFVSFFSFLFIFGIENCTDHANSSSVFHFLLCVCFAIAEMKNCINFYHCLLIFSYAFHSCLTPWSPNSFALLSANSLFFFLLKKCKEKKKTHTNIHTHIFISPPNRLLCWFVRRIDITTESHFLRYFPIKLNKYFPNEKKNENKRVRFKSCSERENDEKKPPSIGIYLWEMLNFRFLINNSQE